MVFMNVKLGLKNGKFGVLLKCIMKENVILKMELNMDLDIATNINDKSTLEFWIIHY